MNEAKKILAFSATEIAHGVDAARDAEAAAAALFAGGANSANMPSVELEMREPMKIIDFLVATGLFDSKSEARRMIDQGGIQIDNQKITDKEFVVSNAEHMVQKGKKTFLRVVVK